MLIPLFSVFLLQKFIMKQAIMHTFSFIKPSRKWLLFAILLPIFMGYSYHTYIRLTYSEFFLFPTFTEFLPVFFIGLTIGSLSALLEEVVWRGNFHYYFRKQYGLWSTACFTAVIWSMWHLQIALFYKSYVTPGITSLVYLLLLCMLSIILTLIREYGKSIVPVAIMHGMMNVFYLSERQLYISIDSQEVLKSIGMLLALLICILFMCHKTVTILKK
ncbi:type II CAAX prenyl endopeptidase Rce1 family protein [Lysinibacillus sp. UGB7]|uniref:CPBP family glutamic-type intramembrane protease n=1 Tax=Lysinibacillus sp. UGB7 TaxID=3411039 RepID=UPI003B7C834D